MHATTVARRLQRELGGAIKTAKTIGKNDEDDMSMNQARLRRIRELRRREQELRHSKRVQQQEKIVRGALMVLFIFTSVYIIWSVL